MKLKRQNRLAYWEHLADEGRGSVLFLHGSGERGSDPQEVLRWGLPAAVGECTKMPFNLYVPQCPTGAHWSDHLADLEQILQVAQSDHEASDLVLAGYSMGGQGALELACVTSLDIKLTIAVAPRYTQYLKSVGFHQLSCPVHIIHGDQDPVVPVTDTLKIFQELEFVGKADQVCLELLEGRDHYIADDVLAIERFAARIRRPYA